MIWKVQKRLIWILALLITANAENACSFLNGAYNIYWNVDSNNNVNYILNYNNFPTSGNYWIAFSYNGFNSVLVSEVRGQVQIQTANIQNSQALPTVGSNVLQSQSGSFNNGNLQANFVIPLAALKAAIATNNCMQWQFYTTLTQSGSSYSGLPQTQQVCNLQQRCTHEVTYASNQYGFEYENNYDTSLISGSNRVIQQSLTRGYQSLGSAVKTGYQSSAASGYQKLTTSHPNNNYQLTTPHLNTYQVTTPSSYGYQATTQFPNVGYQSTVNPEYSQSQTTDIFNVGYMGPPYAGGLFDYSGQQYSAPSSSHNNQHRQQYLSSNSEFNSQQYLAAANDGGQTYTSEPYRGGSSSYSQRQYWLSSNTRLNDPNSPSHFGNVLGLPMTNSNDFVIVNPNYIFLSSALKERYLDNKLGGNNVAYQKGSGSGGSVFRDQNNDVGYDNPGSTMTQAPVLSNDAQNQENFQRVLADPPTTADPSTYTNNIYGYDYRSNPIMQYTLNGNNSQYQPPQLIRFQPPADSPFYNKRQAPTQFTDSNTLVGTAYHGQNNKVSSNNDNLIFYDNNQQSSIQLNTPTILSSNQHQQQNQSQTQWDSSNVYTNTNLAKELSQTTTTIQNPIYPYVNRPYENSKYDPETNVITGTIPTYLPYRTLAAGQGSQTLLDASLYSGSTGSGSTDTSETARAETSYSRDSVDNILYRDNVVNPQSLNYPQVVQQNQQAIQAYTDQNCSGRDPYWCQNYVSQFILWQTHYDTPKSSGNNPPNISVCQALAKSLQFSDHRCCKTVRQAGCTT